MAGEICNSDCKMSTGKSDFWAYWIQVLEEQLAPEIQRFSERKGISNTGHFEHDPVRSLLRGMIDVNH